MPGPPRIREWGTNPLPPEIPKQEAGRRFKAAREAAGWPTAYAAARATGLNLGTYYKYENGQLAPAWPRLLALATALGLDPEILFPELYAQLRKET